MLGKTTKQADSDHCLQDLLFWVPPFAFVTLQHTTARIRPSSVGFGLPAHEMQRRRRGDPAH